MIVYLRLSLPVCQLVIYKTWCRIFDTEKKLFFCLTVGLPYFTVAKQNIHTHGEINGNRATLPNRTQA